MKMKVWVLLLILSLVPCVSADDAHGSNSITGCSDTDGENVLILDDEAVWYADFNKQTGVNALPAFVDPISISPGFYEDAVAGQQICRQNLKTIRQAMKDFPKELDPPSSMLIYTVLNLELGVQNTLICHVTGFYPAPVNITWTKNEQKVTEGANTSVPFPNKDGSFKQTSRLDFIPKQGDVYSCTVEHVALMQPMTKFYAVENSDLILGPAMFCGVGLTVGVLGVAAGIFLLIRGTE
ncbi:rano class II histocompatibility antigen, B alpha chain-like [Pundamilia nyererei]|uniref:Rano class II histocompatibility antigen, B alpha chain-like n=2 Tax=Pundamilia nyererei TaxID=303518 RepID=A0A9Y3W0V3_9CICH|nr:PREDICTED: rano class II histocompatibility antigen, B alpha chain-like [Pundamilia nyererei]